MSKKSYLSNQIRLMSLSTYDLFTDQEALAYFEVISTMNAINHIKGNKKQLTPEETDQIKKLLEQKQCSQKKLADLIKLHAGRPRQVRLSSILDRRKFPIDKNGNVKFPSGVSWENLKTSKRIAEFASEASRAMGLNHRQITFDKIIVKWKSVDILEQIVLDGFTMPVLSEDGSTQIKTYRFLTASAGQLRTDKLQFISEDAWPKIKTR